MTGFSGKYFSHFQSRILSAAGLFVLSLFFIPLFDFVKPSVANAQTARVHVARVQSRQVHPSRRRAGKLKRRKRVRAGRVRYKKPQKSFLSSLFGTKPVRRRSASRSVQRRKVSRTSSQGAGMKSLFGALLGTGNFSASRQARVGVILDKERRVSPRPEGLPTNGYRQYGSGGWSVPVERENRASRQSASPWGRGHYRTMCVRLCDGYYYPISFKARADQLESDEQRCNSGCYNAPTKLFYYSNPGGTIEDMRSFDGQRYKDIANAFKYRKTYVADCRCKAEPWSKQAKQEHESWKYMAQEAQYEQQNRETGEAGSLLSKEAGQTKFRASALQY